MFLESFELPIELVTLSTCAGKCQVGIINTYYMSSRSVKAAHINSRSFVIFPVFLD
jgi:hypothetical protein